MPCLAQRHPAHQSDQCLPHRPHRPAHRQLVTPPQPTAPYYPLKSEDWGAAVAVVAAFEQGAL